MPSGPRFDAALDDSCPLRSSGVRARLGHGHLVIHPKDALLPEVRTFQKSPVFAPSRKLRQVAEHRLARRRHLEMRQVRSCGHTKTLCQLLLPVPSLISP